MFGPMGNAQIESPIGYGKTQIVIYDSFTDADGVLLTAHIPDICPVGSAWLVGGSFPPALTVSGRIMSNKAVIQALRTTLTNVIQSGIANCTIVFFVTFPATAVTVTNAGCTARYTDDNNSWLFNILNSTVTKVMRVTERTGGANTIRASTVTPDLGGQTIAFTITINGNDLYFSIPGGYFVAYNSAIRNTETIHGLSITDTTLTISVDDFMVIVP